MCYKPISNMVLRACLTSFNFSRCHGFMSRLFRISCSALHDRIPFIFVFIFIFILFAIHVVSSVAMLVLILLNRPGELSPH